MLTVLFWLVFGVGVVYAAAWLVTLSYFALTIGLGCLGQWLRRGRSGP